MNPQKNIESDSEEVKENKKKKYQSTNKKESDSEEGKEIKKKKKPKKQERESEDEEKKTKKKHKPQNSYENDSEEEEKKEPKKKKMTKKKVNDSILASSSDLIVNIKFDFKKHKSLNGATGFLMNNLEKKFLIKMK